MPNMWAFPSPSTPLGVGSVSLRARPFGLVAACHKGPTGRGHAAIRFGSPSGPPNAGQRNIA